MPGVRLSLRKNFTWTFAGNAIYAASQWGQLVVLAKMGSPETVGQFALALAVCAPVIMFANLQLRSVQATDARQEYSFADYLGLRLMTTSIAYLVIIGIVLLSGYQRDTALAILLIGISKCFEAVSDVIFGLLQQQERMDRIAKSIIIEGPLTLVAMAVVLYMTHSIVWATGSLALVWGLQLAFYDIPSALMILRAQSPGHEWKLMRPRFDLRRMRPLIWMALPLGFVALLLSLNTSIPRYAIEGSLGKNPLGIFAALSYFVSAGSIVTSALGMSASPRLAQLYSQNDTTAFRNLLLKLLGIGLLFGAAGVLFSALLGKPLLTLAYSAEYAIYNDVFVVLMISAGLSYCGSFLGYGMTAARYFRVQMPLFIVVVILTAVLSFGLAPRMGLMGIALATVITTVVQCAISAAVVVHALRSSVRRKVLNV